MAEWIDVPAHRVLKVSKKEFDDGFEFLMPDGTRVSTSDDCKKHQKTLMACELLILRKKDDKRFRTPRWHYDIADCGQIFFLEEV